MSEMCSSQSDLYSFGMLVYSVYNGGVPLMESRNNILTFKHNVEQVCACVCVCVCVCVCACLVCSEHLILSHHLDYLLCVVLKPYTLSSLVLNSSQQTISSLLWLHSCTLNGVINYSQPTHGSGCESKMSVLVVSMFGCVKMCVCVCLFVCLFVCVCVCVTKKNVCLYLAGHNSSQNPVQCLFLRFICRQRCRR